MGSHNAVINICNWIMDIHSCIMDINKYHASWISIIESGISIIELWISMTLLWMSIFNMDVHHWILDIHDCEKRTWIIKIELWSSKTQLWTSTIRGYIRIWLSVFNAPPGAPNLLLFYPFHTLSLYPRSTKLKGVILVSPCPSVLLWTESCPLCVFLNTSRIHFVFTHLTNKFQKVCCVVMNSKI